MNRTGKNPKEPHPIFCKCNLCMKSGKLSTEELKENSNNLPSVMVNRKDPDAGSDSVSLMKSIEVHSIMKAGTSVNMLALTGIRREELLPQPPIVVYGPTKELVLKAKWFNKDQEKATSGKDSSVFGSLGVLLISDKELLNIPKVNPLGVSSEFLVSYGVSIVPLQEKLEIEPALHKELEKLFLVQYDFHPDYIDNYVMKMTGGGGIFVETHPFPQIFTPMSKDCSGALIVGRKLEDGSISFTSFEVPFGYTIKIQPNVIHGDSFFVGPYAIALNETELADSVLIRKESSERDIQPVALTAVPPAGLHALIHRKLASKHDTEELRAIRSRVLDQIRELKHQNLIGSSAKSKGKKRGRGLL